MSQAPTNVPLLCRNNVRLAFGSIGVVFGDIGTSPLYALREALHHVTDAGRPVIESVYGVVSLLLWALFIVVTLNMWCC